MSSVHVWKSIDRAARMGAYGGRPESRELYDLSKRELVEIALRLGEICADESTFEGALSRVKEERRILKENGII